MHTHPRPHTLTPTLVALTPHTHTLPPPSSLAVSYGSLEVVSGLTIAATHPHPHPPTPSSVSYGSLEVVSGLTIAALEDLGHYLGNYTATGCMAWVFKQG